MNLLGAARNKAPELTWVEADLANLPDLGPAFDAVVLAGNVMIFLDPGSEGRVLDALSAQLVAGGLLIAGYYAVTVHRKALPPQS